jgi:hypothetical protein
LRKFGELCEPGFDVGHVIVGFEVGLVGKHFIKDEVARFRTIFLKEIAFVVG